MFSFLTFRRTPVSTSPKKTTAREVEAFRQRWDERKPSRARTKGKNRTHPHPKASNPKKNRTKSTSHALHHFCSRHLPKVRTPPYNQQPARATFNLQNAPTQPPIKYPNHRTHQTHPSPGRAKNFGSGSYVVFPYF